MKPTNQPSRLITDVFCIGSKNNCDQILQLDKRNIFTNLQLVLRYNVPAPYLDNLDSVETAVQCECRIF